jgi:hypothetical protein
LRRLIVAVGSPKQPAGYPETPLEAPKNSVAWASSLCRGANHFRVDAFILNR